MLNHVDVIGRLVRDPEFRRTESQKAVTTISLAVDRTMSDDTDFFDVVVWGKAAENVCKYLTKGRLVAISGHLQSRKWTDKENKTRYTVEIVADSDGVHFLPSGKKSDADLGDGEGGEA